MEFESANPSVIRSIKQRDLLNTWLRTRAKPVRHTLPRIHDYRPDRIAEEMADMMGFDVEGNDDEARFLITQEGARLAATYGSDHVEPDKRTSRYLDEALDPPRYARVLPHYLACLKRKRPAYSISTVRDSDGRDVSYERLLLPFGRGDTVEQIIGSYKAISIDGGFKIDNLMGIRPKAVPVEIINAIIELDFVHSPQRSDTNDDVIEID